MQTIEGPPERGNPQEPESLAAEVQGGSDEIGRLPARLQRYATGKQRAAHNVAYIRATFPPDSDEVRFLLPRIQSCGSYLVFRNYHTQGVVKLQGANFCKCHLLDPFCAIRRGAKSLKAYLARYQTIIERHPDLIFSHVVMTVKNGPDLLERHNHLKKALHELFKRRTRALAGSRHKTEWAKVVGLVGSYEVTNIGNGWHPHVHMCVLHTDRLDFSAMRDEWLRVTGDSLNFRVEHARHPDEPARDFLEVFKYAVKFSDLTPQLNVEAWQALRKKNLLFSVGLFRGVVVPQHLTDDLPDEDLPFIEYLYEYLDGSYSLQKSRQYHPPVIDPVYQSVPFRGLPDDT